MRIDDQNSNLLYAIAYNCVHNCKDQSSFDFITAVHNDSFHIHHSHSSLSQEHVNPQLTCSQRQWLHSSVG